ncbi:MAG: outer membrane beta-barrel protein [Bacteroidales bacterium]|nr:outer membrane beta-barrel protein [Bacteroidales bacterium]
MKKIFSFAAVALLAVSAAFAQDYTRLQASYVAFKLTDTELGDKEIQPKGINLGAALGFSVTDDLPIYVEPGINLTWAHSAQDIDATRYLIGERKFTYMNVAIPVNGVYKFEVNDKVAISGHAGFNFKVNFMARQHNDDDKFSWLSKKDMGSRDDRANIFQLGGQIGCGVHLGAFYIGYQFQSDFMKFQEFKAGGPSHKWLANYITLGITMSE